MCEGGKWDKTKVKEFLKDMLQGKLRDRVSRGGLLTVIAKQHDIVRKVKEDMQKECEEQNLPLKIIDITLNNPLVPTDPELLAAIRAKATARMQQDAAVEQKNLKEYNAGRDLAIKTKEAEADKAATIVQASADAEKVSIQAEADAKRVETQAKADAKRVEIQAKAEKVRLDILAERWGVNEMPKAEQAAYWLSREGLEAYKEMAKNSGSTYVISGNLLGEINAMLKNFSGGKQP